MKRRRGRGEGRVEVRATQGSQANTQRDAMQTRMYAIQIVAESRQVRVDEKWAREVGREEALILSVPSETERRTSLSRESYSARNERSRRRTGRKAKKRGRSRGRRRLGGPRCAACCRSKSCEHVCASASREAGEKRESEPRLSCVLRRADQSLYAEVDVGFTHRLETCPTRHSRSSCSTSRRFVVLLPSA